MIPTVIFDPTPQLAPEKFHPLEVGGFLNFWEWHLCRGRVRTKMSEFLVFKPGMISKGLSRGVYASIRGCVNTHFISNIVSYIHNIMIYIYTCKVSLNFAGDVTSLTHILVGLFYIPIQYRFLISRVGWDLFSQCLLINLGTSPDDNDHFLDKSRSTLQGTITLSHLGKRNIIFKYAIFWGDMLVPWRVIMVRISIIVIVLGDWSPPFRVPTFNFAHDLHPGKGGALQS